MGRVAHIVDGVVVNIISAPDTWEPPTGIKVVLTSEQNVSPGDLYSNGVFSEDPTRADRVAEQQAQSTARRAQRMEDADDRDTLLTAHGDWDNLTAAQKWVIVRRLMKHVRRLEQRITILEGR